MPEIQVTPAVGGFQSDKSLKEATHEGIYTRDIFDTAFVAGTTYYLARPRRWHRGVLQTTTYGSTGDHVATPAAADEVSSTISFVPNGTVGTVRGVRLEFFKREKL